MVLWGKQAQLQALVISLDDLAKILVVVTLALGVQRSKLLEHSTIIHGLKNDLHVLAADLLVEISDPSSLADTSNSSHKDQADHGELVSCDELREGQVPVVNAIAVPKLESLLELLGHISSLLVHFNK